MPSYYQKWQPERNPSNSGKVETRKNEVTRVSTVPTLSYEGLVLYLSLSLSHAHAILSHLVKAHRLKALVS